MPVLNHHWNENTISAPSLEGQTCYQQHNIFALGVNGVIEQSVNTMFEEAERSQNNQVRGWMSESEQLIQQIHTTDTQIWLRQWNGIILSC